MAAITNLPAEILGQIVSHLEMKRTTRRITADKPSFSIHHRLHSTHNMHDLLDLCLTTRALRDFVQPLMFRNFFSHRETNILQGRSMTDDLFRFLRSLDERPDLAAAVKTIDIDAREWGCDCLYTPCPNDIENATPAQKAQITTLSEKVGLFIDTSELDEIALREALVENLLVRVPNLVRLNMCVPGQWSFTSLRKLLTAKSTTADQIYPLMTNVRHMELDLQKPFVRDDDRTDIPSPAERALVDAAPNVELLCCTAGGLDSFPRLESLHSLQILVRGPWEGTLPRVFKGLPGLKRLSITTRQADLEDFSTPRQIQHALAEHRSTLEYLNVTTHRFCSSPGDIFQAPAGYNMTSLADFSALKTVNLDGIMIWPYRGEDMSSAGRQSDLNLLPDFLPSSIVEFTVDGWGSHNEEHFESLAKAMASGRFPYLDMVLFLDMWCMMDPASSLKSLETGMEWMVELPDEISDPMYLYQSDSAFPDWRGAYRETMEAKCSGHTIQEAQLFFKGRDIQGLKLEHA